MAPELNRFASMDPRVVELQKEAATRDDVIGLAGGLPADELLPRAALAKTLAEVTASREDALQYGWAEGAEQLRRWIAARLAARGATVDPERIIVTAGAQQALTIAARVLGGTIAVGEATYAAAIDAFTRAGARVAREGGEARYVIHGVANPHGVELVDRAALVASRGPLIVDEAYAELRFDGVTPRPLLADAPARVWHIGTVSKTIAPGLRIGWLIPPAAHHAAALDQKAAADLQTSSLTQAALARLVTQLDYDALLARARAAYAERAAAISHALRHAAPRLRFREPEGGFSLWIETDREGDDLALLRRCLDAGVMVDPGSAFRPEPAPTIAVRASYSNATPAKLAEAARRLARVLAQR
ncbi:MAG TPA: PLP-dependent aminotransferase family protein [Kofleriaceae bacterium]|nr:PLP-dependent aminotransferase family protein [Kofleriaceae bacterium]